MSPAPTIEDILEGTLAELDCPGILCAARYDGKISTHSAGSISKKDHQKPFYIYSITKTFTATSVLMLAEQGQLRLDDAFSSYLRRDEVPASATIRQMLNHTAGLSDYGHRTEYQEAVSDSPSAPWSYDKLMKCGLQETPLFEAGTNWAYSNPAYALLKELIEHISGIGEAYGHGGGGPGYTSYAQCYPSLKGRPFSLAIVINKSMPRSPFDLADRITRHFRESVGD